MTEQTLTLALLGAVLLFWAVGAHNRLARLRGDIGRQFGNVIAQLAVREALLATWADAIESFLEQKVTASDDVRAACRELREAAERAKSRPHVAKAIAGVRDAEERVALARTRLAGELPIHAHHISPVGVALGAAVVQVNEQLAAADNALAFTRHQFDATVNDYNEALLQFPTVIIAGLFGFRAAAEL